MDIMSVLGEAYSEVGLAVMLPFTFFDAENLRVLGVPLLLILLALPFVFDQKWRAPDFKNIGKIGRRLRLAALPLFWVGNLVLYGVSGRLDYSKVPYAIEMSLPVLMFIVIPVAAFIYGYRGLRHHKVGDSFDDFYCLLNGYAMVVALGLMLIGNALARY